MKTRLLILLIISALFSSCSFFGGDEPTINLIPYKSGEKWGYIDKEGKIVINPQFNYAYVFIDGIAMVVSSDNKYGFIGIDGKYKVNATYKSATFFSEGLACVVPEDGKPQYIDETGNVKFTINEGKYCGVFNEGFALIGVENKDGIKWGYINKEGNMSINAQFDGAKPFSEGLAAVASTNKEKGETLWGFVDTKGTIIINYQFKHLSNNGFKDGLAVVSDGKKTGFIDKTGKYVINPQFDGAYDFKNGFAVVGQGKMAGYVDKEGKIVINPQFEDASNFSGSLAAVKSSDNKVGFIDKEGKFVINPQFEHASDFFGGIAFVRSGDKWGIIDNEGKYLVNPQFDAMNYDFERYKDNYVESDFFDVGLVVNNFLEGTDDKTFRTLTGATTISQLKTTFPSFTVNSYSWAAYANDNTVLNDHSYVSNTQFTFSENPSLGVQPVYTSYQQTDYWTGKVVTKQRFDHNENIPNDNATLQSATFNLQLTGNKAIAKKDKIYKAINDELVTKASLTVSSSPNVFENANMTVTVNQYSGYASYQVNFKKVGQAEQTYGD